MTSLLDSKGFLGILIAALLILFIGGIIFLTIQGGQSGGRSPNLGFVGSQKTRGMVKY